MLRVSLLILLYWVLVLVRLILANAIEQSAALMGSSFLRIHIPSTTC